MAQKLSYAERVRNAHIPSSSSSLTMSGVESSPPKPLTTPLPPKPVVNVWNVRMEKLAAIRAAQQNPPQDTSSSKSSPADPDRDEDPFVVRIPDHLKTQPPAAPIVAPPPQPTNKTRDNDQQDNWPQVGEALSVSSSPSDSSITDDVAKSVNPNGSPRKGEKTKWVSIPKQELQAAADAASASTSKRHPNPRRSHRQQSSSSTTNTDPSINTNSNTSSTSTSSHPLSQSRTHSTHTSTSHSRAESLQSSPKLSRSNQLPPESDNQRSRSGSDGGHASSGSKVLPANPSRSPKQVGAHRHEGSDVNSRLSKDLSTRNQRASSTQSQTHGSHPSSTRGSSAASSEPTLLLLPTNYPQPFVATAPLFYPQHSHTSSDASNSSSPSIQQLHLISPPPSTSVSAQSLHHPQQRSPFPHAHGHAQPPYPHAPYPLYNLSIPPVNSYDYAPTDIAPPPSHYPPYPPPPPNVKTLANYGQPGSGSLLNGTGPTDRNRGSPAENSNLPTTKSNDGRASHDKMIFGSIHVSSSLEDVKVIKNPRAEAQKEKEEKEKKKPFAIGIENGHDLPGRLRPIQKKPGGRTTGARVPSVKDKNDKKAEKGKKKMREDKEVVSTVSTTAIPPKVSIIEPRWTFGTTSVPPPLPSTSSGAPSPPPSSQSAANVDTPPEDDTIKVSFIRPSSGATTPLILEPQSSTSFLPTPSNIPLPSSIIQQPSPHHPYHVQLRMPSPSALGTAIPLPPPLSMPIQLPLSMPTVSSISDPDLKVKDYGWGFGDASGLGYAPIIAKERAREWEAESARDRAAEVGDNPALGFDNEDVITSPMTESGIREGADKDNIINDQSLPREHMQPREHYGRGRRGFSNPRGGYGDRGAGSYRRVRGMNGLPRGFGRGGHYGSHHNRGGLSPVMSRGQPSSPFNDTPPHHFQTLPLESSGAPSLPPPALGGFYHPHPHHPNPGRPYIPPGYEAFNPSPTIAGVPPPLPVDPTGILLGQPQTQHRLPQGTQVQALQGLMLPSGKHLTAPVPVPMTTIPFPLDSTRYYLLGQLEYYLSPENMAQDFYLRQQMDARGWIPISVIASFNRVRHLTQDVQLVRDVLTLSSLVQVRGNMVRMGGWEPFVLPDAAPSTVEEQPLPYPYQNLTNYYYTEDATANTGVPGAVNGELGYSELLHATSVQQHNNSASESEEGSGVYSGGGEVKRAGASLVNGHAQEVDEDDEDEVEIVMGQGVGTFMYDRRTASS